MTSSVGLFIEALSNLYIVVTYLCIKGWWSLVNKVVQTVYYLADCTHIGYGRLAHSFLSAIFILLAVPDLLASWLLAWSAPLSLAGAGTGLLALTAVAAKPAPLDPGPLDSSRCYVDTACTAFFTNNEAMLAGSSPVDVLINSANQGAPARATAVGSSRFRSVASGRVWSFSDVYYSPDMPATILPLSAMRCAGLTGTMDPLYRWFKFYRNHKLQFTATQTGEKGLYLLDWDPVLPSAPKASEPVTSRFPCASSPVNVPSPAVGVASFPVVADTVASSALLADALADNTMDLWHHRLGHSSERVIRTMAKSGCIPAHRINLRDRLSFCESCAATGMQAVGPVPTAARQADSPSLPTRML